MLKLLMLLVLVTPDWSAVKVCRMWYTDDKDGFTHANHTYGSGVVVWSGKDGDGDDISYILTNSHVAPDETHYDIISYNDGAKKPHLFKCLWVCAVDKDHRELEGDLALLKCYHAFPAVTLSKVDPPQDQDVCQWGFPRGGSLSKQEGKFLGLLGNKNIFFADYMTIPGSSGSGVYYQNKLVGLSFAISNLKDRRGQNVLGQDGEVVNVPPAWIVPRSKIEVFLNRQIPKEMGVTYEKVHVGPRVVSGCKCD